MSSNLRIIAFFLLAFTGVAQTKSLNYQAVIINPNPLDIPGNSVSNLPYGSGDVCIKFSLLSQTDQLEYQEVQCTKTDAYGLVNLNIGAGSKIPAAPTKYSTFDAVVWDANSKKLKVDVSFDEGKTFVTASTQSLTYSAYALYAESVDYQNVRSAPTKLSQFTDDIQVAKIKDLDPLKADINKNKQDIQGILTTNSQTTSQVAIINQSITDINTLNDIQNRRLDQLTTQGSEFNSIISNIPFVYERFQNKSPDTRLGGANSSDAAYPSQRAVKAYVDAQTTPEASTVQLGKIKLAGDLSGGANAPTVPGLLLKENTANKSAAANLGAANTSDVLFPTQKAVKTYVDAQTTPEATTLIQGKVQLAGDLAGTASAPTVPGLALKENLANKSTAVNLGAGATSDELYPSQKAVKTYIDAQTTPEATTLIQGKIQLAGDLSGTSTAPTIPKLALKENLANRSSAITLGGVAASDTLYPTQRAVKTYIDAQTTPNATTVQLGRIQLAGDLTGTATTPRIAANAIRTNAIADSSITTAKILDGNVTDAKIASMQASKLTGNIAVANGGTGVSSITGLIRGNGTGAFTSASYGSFYDLTNQTAAFADSAVAMKLSNTDFSSGITIQNGSQIRVTNAGIYNIQFSAQLDRNSGTATQLVKIWLRKNGVNVPATATEIIISGGVSTAATVASWNFFQNLAANDQVEIMWSVTNPQVYIAYTPPTSTPARPAIPSLIVTINQVY